MQHHIREQHRKMFEALSKLLLESSPLPPPEPDIPKTQRKMKRNAIFVKKKSKK